MAGEHDAPSGIKNYLVEVGMTLQEFLVWLLSGAGSGAVAYAIMQFLEGKVDLSAEVKRYLSLAIAAVVAVGAFMATVGLGYEAQPETVRAWIEAIFSVIAVAIGLSQAIHGLLKLK